MTKSFLLLSSSSILHLSIVNYCVYVYNFGGRPAASVNILWMNGGCHVYMLQLHKHFGDPFNFS